jgi:hypothetical protein
VVDVHVHGDPVATVGADRRGRQRAGADVGVEICT